VTEETQSVSSVAGGDEDNVELAEELRAALAGEVLADPLNRAFYSTDASVHQVRPLLAVVPAGAEDVTATVRIAARRGVPIAPRGAGSGLAGESLTRGIVLDFTRHMNRLLAVNIPEGQDKSCATAVVEAGCVFQVLNDELAGKGWQFGPDPASGNRATLGGMIANNATGAHSMRYGHTGDHIDWIDAVLADGELVRFCADGRAEPASGSPSHLLQKIVTQVPRLLSEWQKKIDLQWPKADRNRAGYRLQGICEGGKVNWPALLAGSEGTLAVSVAAQLRLVSVPRVRYMVQACFASMEACADALPALSRSGIATCELMDATLLDLARQAYPEQAALLPKTAATLLIGVEENDEESAERVVQSVLATLAAQAGLEGQPAVLLNRDEQLEVTRIREKAVPLLFRGRTGLQAVPGIEDVAVGADGMPTYIRRLHELARREGVQLVHYAHAGHGELHIRPFLNLHKSEDRAKLPRLMRSAFELAWELGGSISGEHGCGLVRSGFLADQYGELYELMRQVKATFDPKGVLNPGKIVTDRSGEDLVLSDLRYDAANRPEMTAGTLLHWEKGELEAEMEACNGCGVCRGMVKTQAMCPMFRALLSEESSPRAKANLMRHLVTGLLDESYRRRPELRRIADFCINCKSCVLECPSGVNVPKLMNELKARYARDVGLQKVEKVLAGGEGMSRLGSHFGPVATAATRLAPVRWIMEKLTGVDRRRPMPPFAWGDGLKKLRRHLKRLGPVAQPVDRVVYFVDLLARWNDHALGRAVVDVLHHNNVEVALPDQLSAAMPPIDYGDLAAARPVIRENIRMLLPYVRQGYKIVVSEPTAALCLSQEWLEIEPSDEARELAAATRELTGYLVGLHRAGQLKTDFAPLEIKLGYHAPCHMKALRGGLTGVELVRLIPGVKVTVIQRGCCGIAGTFGFQKRNFELSLKAGAPMLDALKELDSPYGMSECGTCKMQMEFATGKKTFHPIKLVAAAYGLPRSGLKLG